MKHFFNNQSDAELVCRAFNMIGNGSTQVVTHGPENDFCVMPMEEAYDMEVPSWVIYADGSRRLLDTDSEIEYPKLPANQFQEYAVFPLRQP